MKPPFAYYGGKTGMARAIVGLLPPHRVYIEPFFGAGSVFFAKRPAVHEIINDVDEAVVAFFRVLREQPADLERVCRLTPHARVEFDTADLDDEIEIDDLERARRFWVRVNQSFAKTAGRKTGWSVTTARTQSVSRSIAGRIDRFGAVADRLVNTTIECCDGIGLIERLATSDAVVYADPPYDPATRRNVSLTRRNVSLRAPADYRFDMVAADHRRLAEALRSTSATVVLSGYPGDLYDELYGDWWSVDFLVTSFSSNSRTSARSRRTERIWSNRRLDEGRFAWSEQTASASPHLLETAPS